MCSDNTGISHTSEAKKERFYAANGRRGAFPIEIL